MPDCVAVDRSRPCTSLELLAFHNTLTKSSSPLATDAQTQQGFLDERAPINPTVADSSDDEMSEPTARIAKRKEIQTDEKKSYGHRYLQLIRHTPIHRDPLTKRKNSSNDLRNRRFKMSRTCSRRGIATTRGMDFLK